MPRKRCGFLENVKKQPVGISPLPRKATVKTSTAKSTTSMMIKDLQPQDTCTPVIGLPENEVKLNCPAIVKYEKGSFSRSTNNDSSLSDQSWTPAEKEVKFHSPAKIKYGDKGSVSRSINNDSTNSQWHLSIIGPLDPATPSVKRSTLHPLPLPLPPPPIPTPSDLPPPPPPIPTPSDFPPPPPIPTPSDLPSPPIPSMIY